VVAGGESPLGLVDDFAKVLISAAMVVLIAATWKNQTLPSMRRINRIATIAGVLIILFGIFAIVVENSSDAADDFPAIILGVFLVINGVL
jgi:intracellular septation protein A